MDEFVIMPNHVHGIVKIGQPSVVGDRHACPLRVERQYEKLPTIIGSFKSAVTKHINLLNSISHYYWQRSYYDHIIRNQTSLNKIQKYIKCNPLKWELDRNNQNGLWMWIILFKRKISWSFFTPYSPLLTTPYYC